MCVSVNANEPMGLKVCMRMCVLVCMCVAHTHVCNCASMGVFCTDRVYTATAGQLVEGHCLSCCSIFRHYFPPVHCQVKNLIKVVKSLKIKIYSGDI